MSSFTLLVALRSLLCCTGGALVFAPEANDVCLDGDFADCGLSLRQLRSKRCSPEVKECGTAALVASAPASTPEQARVGDGHGQREHAAKLLGDTGSKLKNTRGKQGSHALAQTLEESARTLPKPSSEGELWGGPLLAWSQQAFYPLVVPTNDPRQVLKYAGWTSDIPEDLWGIFWMDQFGKSSVAQDRKYPFEMVGTGEVLASFGEATYDPDTRCVTPVPCYGGAHWTFSNDQVGRAAMQTHQKTRNTLSFCYTHDDYIQIYSKVLTEATSIGPVTFGTQMARMVGFTDAGHGYSWAPVSVLNMGMKKMPWGWDRLTRVVADPDSYPWSVRGVLREVSKLMPISHYPLIQIIDGAGQPTEYYSEYLAYIAAVQRADGILVSMPKTGDPTAK